MAEHLIVWFRHFILFGGLIFSHSKIDYRCVGTILFAQFDACDEFDKFPTTHASITNRSYDVTGGNTLYALFSLGNSFVADWFPVSGLFYYLDGAGIESVL